MPKQTKAEDRSHLMLRGTNCAYEGYINHVLNDLAGLLCTKMAMYSYMHKLFSEKSLSLNVLLSLFTLTRQAPNALLNYDSMQACGFHF